MSIPIRLRPIRNRFGAPARLWLVLLLWLALANVAAAPAQSGPPITYERYDVTFDVAADGSVLVREIQQIRFNGEFQTAFADIPLALTSQIENIQIYEGETAYAYDPVNISPGAYTVESDADTVYVSWGYTPTVPGDLRTFILEYRVVGGLWVYPDQQILEWRAVPADRSGLLVEASTVTVTLPTAVPVADLQSTAYGPAFSTTVTDGQVIFTADEPLPDGVGFQIQVGFPPNVTTASVQNWQVREDQAALVYALPSITVDLQIEPDGRVLVSEEHQLVVEDGLLDQGMRQIPYRFLDGVANVALFEGDQPFTSESPCDYCFQLREKPRSANWARYDRETRSPRINEQAAGGLTISWQFPPLVRGEATTLRLAYEAAGALAHFDDQQKLNWAVVGPDRAVRVDAAQVRIHLPPGVTTADVFVDGAGGAVTVEDERTILVTAPGHIPAQRDWTVGVRLPPNATSGSPPGWQADLEAVSAAATADEIRRARVQLALAAGTLLLLFLGLPSLFLLWYLRGRDLPQPALTDYLPEPPSDLPPGIVAYLLDEKATPKGAMASLFHLANLGLISIRLETPLAFRREHVAELAPGETVTTPTGETVTVPPHLAVLFNGLRATMPPNEDVSLYTVERAFGAILPRVYAKMGEEAQQFFAELPDRARHRWLVMGQWFVLGALALAGLLAILFWDDARWVALGPALSLVILGITLQIISRWMAQRTPAGVEEANRWRAFRTYLRHLKEYGTLEQAQRILDRYFAYAVALDVEEVVLEHATALGGQVPAWTFSSNWSAASHEDRSAERRRRPHSQPQEATTAEAPTAAGEPSRPSDSPTLPTTPTLGRPSLSGLSRGMGNALSEASNNLASFLSTAAGNAEYSTPFRSLGEGTGAVARTAGNVASTTLDIIGEILAESSSGGGGSSYSSSSSSRSSSSRSSWGSSRSSSSRSSSSSSSRSSSSRRSGGGGRRGFG
jgi:hypothetical protein